jgi:hypothetical protein
MTLDLLLKLLRSHLAALQSAWPRPHGPSNGPAFYLDAADTTALLTELTGIQRKLETAGWGGAPMVRSQSGVAETGGNPAEELAEIKSSTQPLALCRGRARTSSHKKLRAVR